MVCSLHASFKSLFLKRLEHMHASAQLPPGRTCHAKGTAHSGTEELRPGFITLGVAAWRFSQSDILAPSHRSCFPFLALNVCIASCLVILTYFTRRRKTASVPNGEITSNTHAGDSLGVLESFNKCCASVLFSGSCPYSFSVAYAQDLHRFLPCDIDSSLGPFSHTAWRQ